MKLLLLLACLESPLSRFTLGRIETLPDGDPSSPVVRNGQIATISSRAVWWEEGKARSTSIPSPRKGARWSEDGQRLYVNIGFIDRGRGEWQEIPALRALITPMLAPGVMLRMAAWSPDLRRVALLIGQGVLLADLEGSSLKIPAAGAESVLLTEDRLVIGAPQVRILDHQGREIAVLPKETSAPILKEGLLLIHADGSLRWVDPESGQLRGHWKGPVDDAVLFGEGIVGLDPQGSLIGACLKEGEFQEAGRVEVGAVAGGIGRDGKRLIFSGGILPTVRVATAELDCTP